MPNEKHGNTAVLGYFSCLLIMVIVNILNDGANFLDIIYLIVVVCSVFKYLMIIKEKRK